MEIRRDKEATFITGAYVTRDGVLRMIPTGRWRRLWMRFRARRVYWQMPLCTCGHEEHEHSMYYAFCGRCDCRDYTERPVLTQSDWDLPVSQGARDLWERVKSGLNPYADDPYYGGLEDALDILAAADERDVRNLLWARRAGKL